MICRLYQLNLDDLARLTQASQTEGFSFVARLAAEYASGANRFEQPGEALFGAYDSELLGVCGLNRDPYTGDVQTGRVRHLYVLPDYRRRGIGARLVAEVIAEARRHYTLLVLRTTNPAADAFYRTLGFEATTETPSATHSMKCNIMSHE